MATSETVIQPREIRNVELTSEEIHHAKHIAERRMETVIKHNMQVPQGQSKDMELQRKNHVMGCIGELAFAKYSARYWQAHVGSKDDGGDVGDIAVRSTDNTNNPRLIVLPRDSNIRIIVMAIVDLPIVSLRGWIQASYAKDDRYWSDPTGRNFWAWFCPQEVLHDCKLLQIESYGYEVYTQKYPSLKAHIDRPVINNNARQQQQPRNSYGPGRDSNRQPPGATR